MSTIAEKLTAIAEAKADIKSAITNKGQSVGDDLTKFADAINAISGGGGSADWIDLFRGKVAMTDSAFSEYEFDKLDTQNVKDMEMLFNGCAALTTIDLTAWNFKSVENTLNMFYSCTKLTNIIGGKTQSDVDGGVSVFNNIACAINIDYSALDTPSICAIIRGLATITANSAMINLSHTQYAALKAYTTVDYIALAKSKGWLVGDGGWSDTDIASEQAGTIIGKDADGNIKYVKYSDFVADDFDTTTFTPVAVLVIPQSHTADGKCRGVSLMQMSLKTPEAGSVSNETMYWGVQGQDETLTNYSSMTTGNVALGETLGVSANTYLPTDSINNVASVVDTEAGVAKSQYGTATPYTPSPYGAEGIVNTQYRDGASNNKVQANTDMAGESNMGIIISVLAGSSASGVLIDGSGAITNAQANYPAFAACYRYQGGGYTDHSWYLPSCGEMGYFIVRWGAINNSLTAIRSKYGTSAACLVNSTTYHWSSTEYNSANARYLMPSSGNVYGNLKYGSYAVRAFHAF